MTIASHEDSKVFQLSDEQLIRVVIERQKELCIALAFGGLVRMLEMAMERTHDDSAHGIAKAISLTKLYAQKFAPGDPKHPFKNFDLNSLPNIKVVPKPIPEPPKPTPKPTLEPVTKPKPVVMASLPTKPKPRMFRGEKSKMTKCTEAILSIPVGTVFRTVTILDMLKKDPDIRQQDVSNALFSLKERKLIFSGKNTGEYIVAGA